MTLLDAANQSLQKAAGVADEIKPYRTVDDIAKQWNTSYDRVRRIFDAEEGVLRIGLPSRRVGRRLRRRYYTLRIPESVFQRVEARMQQRHPSPERRPTRQRSA